ncbi:hypothetical protein, partial [Undibacterium umbellatum]|uniref:hypothetical protein n=1 Tax=Undibacterium umbellatum TaxID=2762300 RepID=UPI001C9B92FD
LVPTQVSLLLPAIPVYISFSVSLFLLIVYFNKQECPKKSGYLTSSHFLRYPWPNLIGSQLPFR